MHTKTTHSVMWIRFLYAYKNHSFRNVNTFLICIQKPLIPYVNTFLICIQKPLIPYCEYVSYMHTKTTHSVWWIRFLYAYKNHSFGMWIRYMHKKPLIPYCEYVSYMHTKTTHSVMWIRFLYAYKNHSFRIVNTFLICIQKPLIP